MILFVVDVGERGLKGLIWPHHCSTVNGSYMLACQNATDLSFVWSQRSQAVGTPSGTLGTASALADPIQPYKHKRS